MGFFSKYISDSEPLALTQDFKSKTTGGIFMTHRAIGTAVLTVRGPSQNL